MLKDLLVQVDGSEQCNARLQLAIELAQSHQAHLTGLYVSQHELLFESQLVDAHIVEAVTREHAEAAQRAKEKFHSFIAPTGLLTEWRSAEDLHSDTLTLNARYADLTIMGQVASERHWAHDLPAQVSLGAGRPVLVVPEKVCSQQVDGVTGNGTQRPAERNRQELLHIRQPVAQLGLRAQA